VKGSVLEGFGLLVNGVVLLVSIVFLVVGSEFTINNSVKISDMTGLGKTTVGFVLVGFATSVPELSVSIFSVANPGNIGVSIGNVLGSNIVNVALVLGVCILIIVLRRPRYPSFLLSVAKGEMGNLHFGLFLASIIPLVLLYIGYASRFVGVILVGIFVYYMVQLARANKTKQETTKEGHTPERCKLHRYAILALAGVVVVVTTSYFIVDSSSFIAESVGIPRVVIGATIVAFGTSIPELATGISSARKGLFDLSLGNIVGSGFINITLILGVALIASPLTVNIAAFSNLVMFSLITNLFLWYFIGGDRISWREGVLLLALYVIFLLTSFGASSILPPSSSG
jgi:cation:H+ antiporter